MTNFVISITVDDVIDAIVAWLTPFMQGGPIVRGQGNRVPMPPNPCCVLTELLQVDISVPYSDQAFPALESNISSHTRIDVQADFYGAASGDICKAVQAAFRTGWAWDSFGADVKPLYTSDGIQAPLITGEQQYESRWTLTLSLQYNPLVTVSQQSAIEANATVNVPVDLT